MPTKHEIINQLNKNNINYIKAKQKEWNSYMTQVHQWKIDQYLTNY